MSTPFMFLLLLTSGLAITGIAGYFIFGPLSFVQARDRGIRMGAHAFAPQFLRWIVFGGFRSTRDRAITGLATPAQILCWCCIVGGLSSALIVLPALLK